MIFITAYFCYAVSLLFITGCATRRLLEKISSPQSFVFPPDLVNILGDVTVGLLSADLLAFSDPDLSDSIVLHNRSFIWANAVTTGSQSGLYPACDNPATPAAECNSSSIEAYSNDLAVMEGISESVSYGLDPKYCLLQNPGGYPVASHNQRGDDADGGDFNQDFINGYFNQPRGTTTILQEATTLSAARAATTSPSAS